MKPFKWLPSIKIKRDGLLYEATKEGFIIRALNLLQLRKLANIRFSLAVSDCLGHIVFHETSVQIGGEKKIYVW